MKKTEIISTIQKANWKWIYHKPLSHSLYKFCFRLKNLNSFKTKFFFKNHALPLASAHSMELRTIFRFCCRWRGQLLVGPIPEGRPWSGFRQEGQAVRLPAQRSTALSWQRKMPFLLNFSDILKREQGSNNCFCMPKSRIRMSA